jgi:hypothetical protein
MMNTELESLLHTLAVEAGVLPAQPGSELPFIDYFGGPGVQLPIFGRRVRRVLQLFESLNHRVNGRVPSESIAKTAILDRSLVYVVSTFFRKLIIVTGSSIEHRSARQAATASLAIAWDCVLAGDIDDILDEVRATFVASEVDADWLWDS